MFARLLIANRGEIACRIIRTARRLGIATVAVYSEADGGARHVREADRAVAIGAAPATASYLDGARIIAAAQAAGAEAIHPGYGFLSESAEFAAAVADAGLVFVGPTPAAMRAIGDKAAAKALAARVGVPVVPGFEGAAQDAATLARAAKRIGYPVMIKAAAGGGGRGMRLVTESAAFSAALDSARREATAAFGDGRLLIERAIARPRHVEIQIIGDAHGQLVHLFERECSLQRRHQKLIEEAPAPGMSAELRARLTDAALRLGRAAGYHNAGTVEFLVEGGGLGADAPFYFIEANPRLQVEHPVTEAITGLDLVEWQLRVAAGERLAFTQSDIAVRGHAVEARICAEDPARGFLPDTGRIVRLSWPAPGSATIETEQVRVESGIGEGDAVSPHYDSLLAKAIASAADRPAALAALVAWLDGSAVLGVRTNMALLRALLTHPMVAAGRLDTGLVEREAVPGTPNAAGADAVRQGVALLLAAAAGTARDHASSAPPRPASPWDARDGFQLGPPREMRRMVEVDGAPLAVTLGWRDGGVDVALPGVEDLAARVAPPVAPLAAAVYDADGGRALVLDRLRQVEVRWPRAATAAGEGEGGGLVAPITGRVARLDVVADMQVAKGDVVAVIEAMKMEHVIVAPHAGRVVRVMVDVGGQVAAGMALAEIAADTDTDRAGGAP